MEKTQACFTLLATHLNLTNLFGSFLPPQRNPAPRYMESLFDGEIVLHPGRFSKGRNRTRHLQKVPCESESAERASLPMGSCGDEEKLDSVWGI